MCAAWTSRSCLPPVLRPSAPSSLSGLYYVRCLDFKELLASSAEAAALSLLDTLRASLRTSNSTVTEEYQVRAKGGVSQCSDPCTYGNPSGAYRRPLNVLYGDYAEAVTTPYCASLS